MKKIAYVNGGVVVLTPYFKCIKAGARFGMPSDVAEIIEPDEEIDGHSCIKITEKKAPTIFKGYYAKTFFSSKYSIAPFFSSSIEVTYNDFEKRILDIKNLLYLNDVAEETRHILYRLSLVAAVASLDTYISDLILFISTKDRSIFLKTAQKFCQNKASNILARIAQMWSDNTLDSAEQEVIDFVLRTSYSNFDRINKDVLKELYNVKILKQPNEINEIFRLRHLIVHRSGKQKNGDELVFEKTELLYMIETINTVASIINDLVKDSEIVKRIEESDDYAN